MYTKLTELNHSQFSMHTCKVLLDIDFNQFNGRVFITVALISTDPDFYVISGRVREFLTEPWWGVKSTAVRLQDAALSIPERIIWIEYTNPPVILNTCVTEVVVSNKTWYVLLHSTAKSTWANMAVVVITISLFESVCKTPYMLPGAAAMCHTHTFQIWSLYTTSTIVWSVESTG